MKKKQIRFMRPSPQSSVNDIFLRGAEANRTMMIIIDSDYRGQPNSVKPGDQIPLLLKDGLEAENKGQKIFKSIMKQLKATNWKFRVTTEIGTTPYRKIMEKYTEKEIKFTKFDSMAEKTRSLLIFARKDSNGYQWLSTIDRYLALGKQVCVVDEFGVKRYPRTD
ncbi:MAG: hypothetical protein ACTSW7_01060 [Candidatus Thorarchaeota archaeon]|nr:MAG: hypothetical protein DRQ25_04875 [Candidatus Fermentibacteria bacterium]HEC72036.1 hypothetical protein [Thermoplasmatales archaeon]